MMVAISFSETSVFTTDSRRHIPEYGILQGKLMADKSQLLEAVNLLSPTRNETQIFTLCDGIQIYKML
jgi:hypothetical protein